MNFFGPTLLLKFAYSLVLAYAAVHDVMARTVPDRLSASLFVLALAFRVVDGQIGVSLWCGAVWAFFSATLFLLGWLGGGDAKLLPGAALMASPTIPGQANLVLAIGVAGGLLGICYCVATIVLRRRRGNITGPGSRGSLLGRWKAVEAWRLRRSRFIPYAVAIAGGTLWAIWL